MKSHLQSLFLACLFAAFPAFTSAADDATDSAPGEAVEIFDCDFGEDWDVNYDAWPDRWVRMTGPEFPQYVAVELAEDASDPDNPCLRMALDGASAEVLSPPIPVLPRFSYTLEARARTENLVHSRVVVEVDFLDDQGHILQRIQSPEITSTEGWMPVRLESMTPAHAEIDRAVIRISARRGDRGDLTGAVWIDAIRLERLPSMSVAASDPLHIYHKPEAAEVICTLRGIQQRNPEIEFQLLDSVGEPIEGGMARLTLDGKLIEENANRGGEGIEKASSQPAGYEGEVKWRPPIADFGFYRVRVAMFDSENHQELKHETVTLAVLPPLDGARHGVFGWTLPEADRPLSFGALAQLLPQLGINWVKLPVWFAPGDLQRGDQLVRFADRLAAEYIDVVGLIVDPQMLHSTGRKPMSVVELFSGEPAGWLDMFDHVMTRLSLRVRWWQLGVDNDTTFIGYADLNERIDSIRQTLFRFGQDVHLGIGWRWNHPIPAGVWEFAQMASLPPLSTAKLREALAASSESKVERWILIDIDSLVETPDDEEKSETDPLAPDSAGSAHLISKSNTSPSLISEAPQDAPASASASEQRTPRELQAVRIRGLADRMITAKIHGARGIYCPNPFTDASGLMTADGKPGELLLPWRTTASMVGGAEYLGQLELPHGSTNYVFRRHDGQVVMVLWNDEATEEQPIEETLFLGDAVQHLDIWGRPTPVTIDNDRNVTLRIGPLPTFAIGLHEALTRWRISIAFDSKLVPSVFGVPHANGLALANPFGQGIGGTVTIFVPDEFDHDSSASSAPNKHWSIAPERGQFSIKSGGEFHLPLEIKLDEATYGRQPVRLDFDFEADKRYKFSVWRNLFVGQEDIDIKLTTRLDESGALLVDQWMVNRGKKPTDFKCLLYAPSSRRKRTQVFMLGPEGDTKHYEYPNGKELAGRELKLRVEEINGSRTMIYRFVAEP